MKAAMAARAAVPTYHLFSVSRVAALLARPDACAHVQPHCPMLALQLALESARAGYRIRR